MEDTIDTLTDELALSLAPSSSQSPQAAALFWFDVNLFSLHPCHDSLPKYITLYNAGDLTRD